MNICKLGDVYFTTITEETYNYSNDITDKPMEDGTKVTENAVSNPTILKINGIITGKDGYPQERLTRLRMYSLNRDVVRYVGAQRFGKVVIESFENVHTSTVADGIEFSMSLKVLTFATKTIVNINTGKYSIPDIERLKEQLEEQKKAREEAKRNAKQTKKTAASTKVKAKSSKGRQPKRSSGKKSVLQNIVSRY